MEDLKKKDLHLGENKTFMGGALLPDTETNMPYFKKLLNLEMTLEPGKVNHVGIFHDDWCTIYEGGPCSCDADVLPLPGPQPLRWAQDFRRRCRERRKAKRGKA